MLRKAIFRYFKKPKYFIQLVGLATGSTEGIAIIDEKYGLIEFESSYTAAIVPFTGNSHPSLEEVVFYVNCLTYTHDIPIFLRPAKGKALAKPIERGRASYINNSYYDSICSAYENINSLRLGPSGCVNFRWPVLRETVHLSFTSKYSKVSKEISLYSMAIRQLDPLSEFLNYYRVIESISGNNGKNWLIGNINRLVNYDFGFLEFETALASRRRKNLFGVYRRRALSRLKTLTISLNQRSITEYFYNINRCGIAHGSKAFIKVYDFDSNIRDISQDVYILKLLARIAIEDKIK